MDSEQTQLYEKFSSLLSLQNYTANHNGELLQVKKELIEAFRNNGNALRSSDCIQPLVDLRTRMNSFFFATNEERHEVDGFLVGAFRHNAHLVTEEAVTARLDKVSIDSDIEWGAHLAIAASMIEAVPEALADNAWEALVAWSGKDGTRETRFQRRNFIGDFAARCGKSFKLR